jgi:hypothetical protein
MAWILSALLAACGGGGGGSGAPAGAGGGGGPASVTLTGTVASGAPLAGAKVTCIDHTGATVGTATTAADGTYSMPLAAGAQAPMVLHASLGTTALVSMLPDTSKTVVNITPVTHLIAALLSSNGDPQHLDVDAVNTPSLLDAAAVGAAKATVATLLEPITDACGTTGDDFVNNPFAADGTGDDRLLESVDVRVRPTGTQSDIEISVRQTLPIGAQPTTLIFTSNAPPSSVSYTVDPASLIPSGFAGQLQTLLNGLGACTAVPLSSRVSGGQITSTVCTGLFAGANPANFLQDGNPATSALPMLVNATGGSFINGHYLEGCQYSSNGTTRVAQHVTFQYQASDGSLTDIDTEVDTESGIVRLIGDQYQHSSSISPFAVYVEYPSEPAADYVATGFIPYVGNVTVTTGGVTSSIFRQVVVTTPTGSQYTLAPQLGIPYLVLQNPGGGSANTNGLYITNGFTSAATAAAKGVPATYVSGGSSVWASPPTPDASIVLIPSRGAWEFDFYLAGNTSSTPDEIEYRRSLTRPLSLAEFTSYLPLLPTLTTPSQPALAAASVGTAPYLALPAPASGPEALSWSLAATGPTVDEADVFGYLPSSGTSFADRAAPAAGQNSVQVSCQAVTSGDPHCNGANWASGALFQTLQLESFIDDVGSLLHDYSVQDMY